MDCKSDSSGNTHMLRQLIQWIDDNSFKSYVVFVVLPLILGFFSCLIYYLFAKPDTHPILFGLIGAVSLGLGGILLRAILGLGTLVSSEPKRIQEKIAHISIVMFLVITFWSIFSTNMEDPRNILTGFLMGLVGTVVTVVGIQVYLLSDRVGSVGDSVATANREIVRAVETFEGDQIGSMSSAIKALENALAVKGTFEADKLKDMARTLHPGIEAMGLSYKAWAERLQTDDPYIRRVWRAAFPSFFREEAYDIQGREMITNGRNYCYLLLGTLSQLMEQNKEGTVIYYQVTPVHPKDWYNWPHGFGKNHFYFENEFIGVYHRSLKALIRWASTSGKSLEHGRYVLCLSGAKNIDDIDQFSWYPAARDEFERPEQFWLLDVPVPLDDQLWPEPQCRYCKALRKYYLGAHRRAAAQNVLFSKVTQYAVPAWNWHGWERDSRHPLAAEIGEVIDAVKSVKTEECTCVDKLLSTVKTTFTGIQKQQQHLISERVATRGNERLSSAWKRVVECINDDCALEYPRLLEAYHLVEVLSGNQENAELVRGFLPVVLRAWSAKQCTGWGNLYDVFGKSLHSTPANARLIRRSHDQLKEWPVPEPEFGIFGWRSSSGADIQWKVVIATSLNYPFDVARIRVYENNSKSIHYNEYQKYDKLITQLIKGEIPSEQLVSHSSTT